MIIMKLVYLLIMEILLFTSIVHTSTPPQGNLPKTQSHIKDLLVAKLYDMPISEIKRFLKETILSKAATTNRAEGAALLFSIDNLLENAGVNNIIDKNLLESATIGGLQDAIDDDGNVDNDYLKDLQDITDLKDIGDELGWDLSDMTEKNFHDILEEPLILERMLNDEEDKKNNNNNNKKKNGDDDNNESDDSDKTKEYDDNIENYIKQREIHLLRDKTYNENYRNEQAAEAHFQLAYLLHREGHLKSAIEEYEACLKINKKHASALHMLNAIQKKDVKKAETQYVVDLFDYYAPNYDKHMVGVLQFKTPFLIHKAVNDTLENLNETKMTILDLGCGTGLCGSLFASPVHTIIGVDLSSSMAHRAKSLNVYEKVIVADVLNFASNVLPKNKIDLVLLSDVLGYIGDVSVFFQDLSNGLRKNGMIALTIEVLKNERNHDDKNSQIEHFCNKNEKQYSMHTLHGRFRHCKQYILDSLINAGMHIIHNKNVELRLQHRKGVTGQLIIGQKL